MQTFKMLLCMALLGGVVAACGDDEKDTGDKDSSSEPSGSDEADAGNEVDGLAACTDFQTASWDRIRDCGSALAEMLPSNDKAGVTCSAFCDVEDKTIPKDDYDACVALAESVPCEAFDVEVDGGMPQVEIPEVCSFLHDTLSCKF